MRRFLFAAVLLPTLALAQQPIPPPVVQHPTFPTGDTTQLGTKIATLLADPTVSRAHWGIAVTALDGTPIYGHDEGKLFRPASNAKIFTTAAAMALLGPARIFETKVIGKLDATSGIVRGDLTLVGSGDPSFASNDLPYIQPSKRDKNVALPQPLADLEQMADQVAAKGIKRITGNIVGDDQYFLPYEPIAEAWGADDLVWGYGAPVSALTINDNQLKLTITPGKITGAPGHETYPGATVTLEQFGIPYYTVLAQVETRHKGEHSGVQVERTPGSRTVRVYGAMAEDDYPDVEYISIDDPAHFAAMALLNMLQKRGITVDGQATPHHYVDHNGMGFRAQLSQPLTCETQTINGGECAGGCEMPAVFGDTLAIHISAPLAQDIVLTDKISQNLHAEMMLHQLGRRVTCGTGSTASGARLVKAFLLHAGLDPDDFIFYDGSGLSTHDLVAPRATAKLLSFATTQPWFAQWKAALPVGGEDGTLTSRFPSAPLKGHLFAKTGTLGESRALSGYVDCASGKQVIFSIMVDDHSPMTSADRVVMDKIVATIAAEN